MSRSHLILKMSENAQIYGEEVQVDSSLRHDPEEMHRYNVVVPDFQYGVYPGSVVTTPQVYSVIDPSNFNYTPHDAANGYPYHQILYAVNGQHSYSTQASNPVAQSTKKRRLMNDLIARNYVQGLNEETSPTKQEFQYGVYPGSVVTTPQVYSVIDPSNFNYTPHDAANGYPYHQILYAVNGQHSYSTQASNPVAQSTKKRRLMNDLIARNYVQGLNEETSPTKQEFQYGVYPGSVVTTPQVYSVIDPSNFNYTPHDAANGYPYHQILYAVNGQHSYSTQASNPVAQSTKKRQLMNDLIAGNCVQGLNEETSPTKQEAHVGLNYCQQPLTKKLLAGKQYSQLKKQQHVVEWLKTLPDMLHSPYGKEEENTVKGNNSGASESDYYGKFFGENSYQSSGPNMMGPSTFPGF